jgi:hypothetical protein
MNETLFHLLEWCATAILIGFAVILGMILLFGFFFATHRGKWWVKGYWEERKAWFYHKPKPIGPEELLFVVEIKPKIGDTTQNYYHKYAVTRVVRVRAKNEYRAYGKKVGPSSGPGTESYIKKRKLNE